METKEIDLTKYRNLHFKAVVDGSIVSGQIFPEATCHIRLDFGYKRIYLIDDNLSRLIDGKSIELNSSLISDFEIVPRDPETYQDWQVGDIIYNLDDEGNTVSGEDEMCRVIFRSGELVAIAENYSSELADIIGCYTCSQLFREGWRLALTDIEKQIIGEKKKYEPQDGDVCYAKSTSGFYAIVVYNRCELDRKMDFYVSFDSRGGLFYSGYTIDTRCLEELRPATEEEKQRLFEALSKEGKWWNAEKKVVEDIPKPYEFKKGEPVLVRNHDYELWSLFAYHEQAWDKHIVKTCFHTVLQSQCIPYNERTMHLLGTAEDYKEEQL